MGRVQGCWAGRAVAAGGGLALLRPTGQAPLTQLTRPCWPSTTHPAQLTPPRSTSPGRRAIRARPKSSKERDLEEMLAFESYRDVIRLACLGLNEAQVRRRWLCTLATLCYKHVMIVKHMDNVTVPLHCAAGAAMRTPLRARAPCPTQRLRAALPSPSRAGHRARAGGERGAARPGQGRSAGSSAC